ncbi:MAG: C39 family peptidase [Caldilineaceae bacterium]
MRTVKQFLTLYAHTWSKAAVKRRLLCLAAVCATWCVVGWLSFQNNLFEGILWQASQAAALPLDTVQQSNAMPTYQPARPAVALTGISHEWQTLNNCGPTVLAMNFSYYGVNLDAQTIAQVLRPNPDDENVRSDELARYALEQGFQAALQVNGNTDQLRLFLSNGIPVIIETWESDSPAGIMDGFAHFRLVTGYDDANHHWIVYDSYIQRALVNPQGAYRGMYVDYAEADQLWRIMNRKYVVVYKAEQAPLVQRILGDNLNNGTMWQRALAQAQTELKQQPNDEFAWFNYGSSLYALNRSSEAVTAFQKAAALGLPERMDWYQYEPLEADYATGRYTDLIQLADANLASATGIEELYYWKALALAALDNPVQAQQALQQALTIKPNYQQALTALQRETSG